MPVLKLIGFFALAAIVYALFATFGAIVVSIAIPVVSVILIIGLFFVTVSLAIKTAKKLVRAVTGLFKSKE